MNDDDGPIFSMPLGGTAPTLIESIHAIRGRLWVIPQLRAQMSVKKGYAPFIQPPFLGGLFKTIYIRPIYS